MKKALLMMAAALTAWSVSAQLYVTGDNVEGASANWDPESPLTVTAENGEYTFVATGNFKISLASGTWAEFNAGAYQLSGSWDKAGTTATCALSQGDGNVTTPMSGVAITYTVKDDLSTITATLPDGYSFDDAPAPDFYLIGGFNTWTLKDEAYKMTREGNVYTLVVPADIDDDKHEGWKINDGSWAIDFGQGEEGMPVIGTVYNLAQGGSNLTTVVPAGATVTFTYVEGGQSTLLITDGSGPVDPIDTPDHLYVVGTVGDCNWTPELALEMTKEDNVFSISDVELVGQAMFSFLTTNTGDASWNDLRYGAAVDGTELTFTENEATLNLVSNVGDVGAIVATPGKYDMTVTFTESGALLKVVKTEETPVVEDLVLTGNFNNWVPNDEAYKMTKDGNTYTYTAETFPAGEFKIKTAEETWTTSWGGEGVLGDETATSVDVTPNVAMNAWQGSSLNFNLVEGLKNVTITFVKSENASVASTLTVAGQSAIETVEAAATEAPAEYYNLQGIRVLAPEAGQLYIINRAGKVSKEIAR